MFEVIFCTMSSLPTGLTFDERMSEYHCPWDPTYVECPGRFTRVLQRCRQLGVVDRCVVLKPRDATEDEILSNHSKQLLEVMKKTDGEKDQEVLKETASNYDCVYLHPNCYRLSLLSAGSSIQLTMDVLDGKLRNGFALVRPPGHHATADEICGYCYFNNVAICARSALRSSRAKKILIVDWDVHHGQGTQRAFYDDPRVLYFSIHRYEYGYWWPELRESDFDHVGSGDGSGFNVNVPLNVVGNGDAEYLAAFTQLLMPIATEFSPDLVLVSAGYDPAMGCPEGEQEVSPACFAHLTRLLMTLAEGKVVALLEGGYFLTSLAEGAALTVKTLLGDPCPALPFALSAPKEEMKTAILSAKHCLRPYWKCLQAEPSPPPPPAEPKWLGPPLDRPRPTKFDVMCPTPPRDPAVDARFEALLEKIAKETDYNSLQRKVSLCLPPDLLERQDQSLCYLLSSLNSGSDVSSACTSLQIKSFEGLDAKSPQIPPSTMGCMLQAVDTVISGRCRAAVAVIPDPRVEAVLAVATASLRAGKKARKVLSVAILDRGNEDVNETSRKEGEEMMRITVGAGLEDTKVNVSANVVDVKLPRGGNNEDAVPSTWSYMHVLFSLILPIGYEFAPDIVLLQATVPSSSSSAAAALPLLAHHLASLCPLVCLLQPADGEEAAAALTSTAANITRTLDGREMPRISGPQREIVPNKALNEAREKLSRRWKIIVV